LGAIPSFHTFISPSGEFNFDSKLSNDANIYNVKVAGKILDLVSPFSTITSTSITYKIFVISLTTTYLIPQAIPDIFYFVGDPALKVNLIPFQNMDTRFQVLYTLTTVMKTPLDASLFSTTQTSNAPYI
jgi:hypothetical protein